MIYLLKKVLINGQGLFASTDIPKGTDLGVMSYTNRNR